LNWIDVFPFVLVLVYAVLGYFTGVLRRLISLISLYVACLGATGMGHQAGTILQQATGMETPDSRIYGFFGLLAAVLILIDGAAQLANTQIQIEAIVWNRLSGVLVGILMALLLSVIVVFELEAAGNPSDTGQMAGVQATVHDLVGHSKLAVPIVDRIDKPIIAIFQPVLPNDPNRYFSHSPST
jgi:uncharacterized membrane protein required for colicin V production